MTAIMNSFSLKRFLFSRFAAALGDQFMLFAVPLVILKYTGSVRWSALAFAIEWAPRLLFLPIAGQIADRVNVNRLYLVADGIRAMAVVTASVLIWWHPPLAFWALSLMMAALSILQSLVFIGMETTLPRNMSMTEIPKAQSLLQSCDQASLVLGPALAGFAVGLFQVEWVMTSGAVFFVLSLINSFGMPDLAAPKNSTEKFGGVILKSYSCGLKVIRENPILLQLIALTWTINVLFGGMLILTPAVVTQTFAMPEKYYGLLQTSAAVLSLISLAMAPYVARRFGLGKLGGASLIASIVGGFIAAFSGSYFVYVIGAVLVLGCDGLFNVYVRTLRAQIIPRAHFGKVTGLIILINNSSLPFGGLLVSALAKTMAHQEILLSMSFGALTCFIGALAIGKRTFQYPNLMPSIRLSQGEQ